MIRSWLDESNSFIDEHNVDTILRNQNANIKSSKQLRLREESVEKINKEINQEQVLIVLIQVVFCKNLSVM